MLIELSKREELAVRKTYRFAAILLILSLLLTILPAAVLAEDGAGAEEPQLTVPQGEASADAQDLFPGLTDPDEPDEEITGAAEADEDGNGDPAGETPEDSYEPAPPAGQQVPAAQDEPVPDNAGEPEPSEIQEEPHPAITDEQGGPAVPGEDAIEEEPSAVQGDTAQEKPPLRGSGTGSPLVIITQPTDQILPLFGGIAYFTVIASGDELSYQWQEYDGQWRNLTWYQGATTNTLQVPAEITTDYCPSFRCVITDSSGEQAITDTVMLISYYLPTITSRTKTQKVVEGSIATFTVTARTEQMLFPGSSLDIPLSYRWQVSKDQCKTWEDTSEDGHDTNTLRVSASRAKNAYHYRCIITNPCGSTTSYACKLTVYWCPEITYQPPSKAIVAGNDTSFAVNATGGGLQYQWQVSKDGGATWENTEVKSKRIPITADKSIDGYRYRCIISNPAGQVTSRSATLTVLTKPAITVQPSGRIAASGKTADFTVTATGGNLKYRWDVSKDGGATWGRSYSTGNTANKLTVTAYKSMDGYLYRCTIYNAAGTITTRSVRLTVQTKPTITTQPTAKSVVSGNTATFRVYASGGALKYQWQISRDGGATWVRSVSPGSTTNTLSVAGYKSMNGYRYRCVITNLAGTVTTKSVKLTVLTKPVITTQPKARTASSGSTVTFTVAATGGDLRYQWYVSKKGDGTFEPSVSPGNATNTLTVKAYKSMDGYCYWCIVSNAAGMTLSSSVRLTVN